MKEHNMSVGANVLMTLKHKMKNLRDELDDYKDKYDEKCHELEHEKAERAVVCFSCIDIFT